MDIAKGAAEEQRIAAESDKEVTPPKDTGGVDE